VCVCGFPRGKPQETHCFQQASQEAGKKPLFILEPLGVEFGASPDFPVGVIGAGELHTVFLEESRTTRERSMTRQELRLTGMPDFPEPLPVIAIVGSPLEVDDAHTRKANLPGGIGHGLFHGLRRM
jgi:hypothetical protein